MSKKEDTVLLSLSYFWSARAPIPLVNVINFFGSFSSYRETTAEETRNPFKTKNTSF